MKTKLDAFAAGIDWPRLRQQKADLLTLAQGNGKLDGLINLLDTLQDAAVTDGLATETEVFGE